MNGENKIGLENANLPALEPSLGGCLDTIFYIDGTHLPPSMNQSDSADASAGCGTTTVEAMGDSSPMPPAALAHRPLEPTSPSINLHSTAMVSSAAVVSSLLASVVMLRKDRNSLKRGVSGLNGPPYAGDESVVVAGGGIVIERDVVVVPPSPSLWWLSSRLLEENMATLRSSSELTSAGVGETSVMSLLR